MRVNWLSRRVELLIIIGERVRGDIRVRVVYVRLTIELELAMTS